MDEKKLRDLTPITAKMYSGVRVKYKGNVLYCCRSRSADENFEHIKRALCELVGMDFLTLFGFYEEGDKSLFEQNDGTVEFYRESG